MNIDYWLIESQEDLEKFEMTTEIASPADMAKAIKRVRELANNFDKEEPRYIASLTYELAAKLILKALDDTSE